MKLNKLTLLLGMFAVTALVTLPSIGCSDPAPAETGSTEDETASEDHDDEAEAAGSSTEHADEGEDEGEESGE